MEILYLLINNFPSRSKNVNVLLLVKIDTLLCFHLMVLIYLCLRQGQLLIRRNHLDYITYSFITDQNKTRFVLKKYPLSTKAVHINKITVFVWKTVPVSTTDLLRLIKTTAWIKHNNILCYSYHEFVENWIII